MKRLMQNLGIHAKIWLSVSVFGLGYVTLLILSQWTGYRTEAHLDVASSSLFPAALKSREAEEAFQRLTKRYNDAVLLQDAASLKEADTDAKAVAAALEAIQGAKGLSEERKQAIAKTAGAFPQYAAKSKSAYTSMVASKDNLSESMQSEMTSLAQQTKQLEAGLREIQEGVSKDFQDELAAVTSSSSSQRRFALLLFIVVLAVSVIVVNFTIRRAIAEPIFGAVRGVRQAVQRVGSATGSVSSASEALARGATEQAASLEDASSSLEEVSSMTQQNAANARKADEVMKEAAGMVDGSVRSMSELTNAMNEMFEASREITKVMQTIDDIAFQTNLLALNAAVEAARAGEFGASFSVVAQEVRGLAQRARESAVGTSTLIEQIMGKVTRGRTLLSEANQAFRNVDKAVSDSGKLVSEIAAASAIQAKNLDDVTQAIHRVEVVTRQNAADAKETSQASTTMHDEAKLVSEIVQELVAVVGSGKE